MTVNVPLVSDSDVIGDGPGPVSVLRGAVEQTSSIGRRVFGEHGGIAQQIIDGEWDDRFSPETARDAAARWEALGEHIRAVRATAEDTWWTDEPRRDWLCGLPLNRKERYYTGTVLPGLVGADGFAHLGRFLALCGLDIELDARRDEVPNLLFVTEYGFAESVFTDEDRGRWGTDSEADTPDIVIAGPDWLVAVEAKMFHNPTAADLDAQMDRQSKVISRWVDVLDLAPERVVHVLLLPEKLAAATGDGTASGVRGWPVITWEQVLAEYNHVGPRYWSNVLATALSDYDFLVSAGPAFGKNKDARLTGSEIVDLHSEGTLPYSSVGRAQGLHGEPFRGDVVSGAWRTFAYEVRVGDPPNANWFPIAEFIAATAQG